MTRASSSATTLCRGANWTPNTESTTSKLSSPKGRSSASPCDPVHRDALLGRAAASRVEQLRRDVEADHVPARGGGRERDVPGACGDIQHVVVLAHGHPLEQVARRHLVDPLGHGRVVAGRPGGAVGPL